MSAGKLNERVVFGRLVGGVDAYGNPASEWDDDYLTVWADVLETPGREALAAGRVEASRTATMRVRRSPDSLALTEADRVSCRGRVWNIRSIGDVSRNREMLEFVIEVGVAI